MSQYTFKPDRFSSHSRIITYLKSLDKKKVLDVGCSRGFIGRQLPKHEFHGLELDRKDAAYAKKYYTSVQICDIEHHKPKFTTQFDVIVFADIIEHVRDPLEIVKYFSKFLKKNGIVIISIPNIANAYVRVKLLFGNFDYEERGLLDKTHLRFFTVKSARKFARKAGLIIKDEMFTPIPLPMVHPSFGASKPLHFVHWINYAMVKLQKRLFSFQIILVCKKK